MVLDTNETAHLLHVHILEQLLRLCTIMDHAGSLLRHSSCYKSLEWSLRLCSQVSLILLPMDHTLRGKVVEYKPSIYKTRQTALEVVHLKIRCSHMGCRWYRRQEYGSSIRIFDANPNSATPCVWVWASYLTPLCLSFITCEMGIIIAPDL